MYKQARVSVRFTSTSHPDLQLTLYPLNQLHAIFVVDSLLRSRSSCAAPNATGHMPLASQG